jgi:hypothetical protein
MIKSEPHNFVIIRYPAFTGGNFICNSLTLSRHTLVKNPNFNKHLLRYPDDYEYRLNAVLTTLPPNKSEMLKWVPKYPQDGYEWKNSDLFCRQDITDWSLRGQRSITGDFIWEQLNSGLDLFLTFHPYQLNPSKKVLTAWPNARIINLVNFEKFWAIASALKQTVGDRVLGYGYNESKEKYAILASKNWPSWKEFERSGFDIKKFSNLPDNIQEEITEFYPLHTNKILSFDIDSNIFIKENYLNAMKELYLKMGYDDFNSDILSVFWQKYIQLHIDI